jgi:hypothetical protein
VTGAFWTKPYTVSSIHAIDIVLTALSGGRIDDKKVSVPDVQRAAVVAGEVPALVGEIGARPARPGAGDYFDFTVTSS